MDYADRIIIETETQRQQYPTEAQRRDHALAQRLREGADRLTPDVIRARLANPPQRTEVTGNPLTPEMKTEMADGLAAIMAGNPTPEIRQMAKQFETTWRATEFATEQFYQDAPELRWLDLNTGADDRLRRAADEAAQAFSIATAPGIPAVVATCRPGAPWVMNTPADLADATAAIADETHCDLRMTDGTSFGSCMERHRQFLNNVHRWDGSLGQARRQYFAEHFVTVPFARGDLIILVRFCTYCLNTFLAQNAIDPAKCVVSESYSDGFGSIPWSEAPRPAEIATELDDAESTD